MGLPYTEVLTFLGSGFMSFTMKYLSQRAKERKEMFDMAMDRQKANEEAANNAVKRVSIDAGKVNRRVIVLGLFFGVMIIPFILALLNYPIYVENIVQQREWLFGLIGGGERTEWVQLDGYVIFRSFTHLLATVVGFYFGNASAK